MKYEKARNLLLDIQQMQILCAHQNGRWSPAKEKKMRSKLNQLLVGLLGRPVTQDEIAGAHSK